jgi:glycosyltransferase involved in cell wall biosynthesis
MVAAVSNELRDRLVKDGWVSHCKTIFNGVDTTLFSPDGRLSGLRQQLGLRSGELLIGHLGRLDPIKRHSDLIAAARLLTITPRMPPFRVVIMGSGPIEEALRKDAAGCRGITILPATHEVPAVLRELDILVLCSAHEGAPRIILEAMATGLPILATAVGGIPEMLSDTAGPCGYLVPVNQPQAIAAAILEIVECPVERMRRAALARNRVAAHFSAQREWLDYKAVYE